MINTMWYYNNEIYDATEEALKEWQGFVYIITDLTNGKMYVGKKGFWSKKTKPPLKGKTRKRRSIVESDWKTYYGSSDLVKQLYEEKGDAGFRRDILHFCKTKGEMSYLETKEQFLREVLLDDNYYNGIINCRIHRSHVTGLK
tara:strand:- start:2246 stop:2674 length:429 start_codon:yes stop_codon:yes gene_type:complete